VVSSSQGAFGSRSDSVFSRAGILPPLGFRSCAYFSSCSFFAADRSNCSPRRFSSTEQVPAPDLNSELIFLLRVHFSVDLHWLAASQFPVLVSVSWIPYLVSGCDFLTNASRIDFPFGLVFFTAQFSLAPRAGRSAVCCSCSDLVRLGAFFTARCLRVGFTAAAVIGSVFRFGWFVQRRPVIDLLWLPSHCATHVSVVLLCLVDFGAPAADSVSVSSYC
jgi:hypothetical protein